MKNFEVQGARVALDDLLKLQLLAGDIHKITAIPSKSRRLGEQHSKARGQGREFKEMKGYQQGDDVRHIDWRMTAKKQMPFVRVMEEDRHSMHLVVLDLSSRMFFGTARCLKSVLACHWAAFLIWRIQSLKHPVRLFICRSNQKALRCDIHNQVEAAHACRVLVESHQALAQHFLDAEDSPREPLHWQHHPHVWFISDFLEGQTEFLEHSLRRCAISQLICLQVLDQFDVSLPEVGDLPVAFQRNTGYLHTQDPQVRAHYQQHNQSQCEYLSRLAKRYQGLIYPYQSQHFHWQEVLAWPLYH